MRRFIVLALCAAFVSGCGSSGNDRDTNGVDDVLITTDNAVNPDTDTPVDTAGDNVVGDISGDATGDIPGEVVEITRKLKLQIDPSIPLELAAQQDLVIRAQLVDLESDVAIPNAAINFKISYCEDITRAEEVLEYDGYLLRLSAISDGSGSASTTLRAGEDIDLMYSITISSYGAEDVVVKVHVLQKDCSCSDVTITFDGIPGDAASYRVIVFDSTVTCASVIDADTLPLTVAEIDHGSIDEPARIPCLTPGGTYTVLVTGSRECPFAKGCAEGVTVGAANDQEVCGSGTVALTGIDVNIEGSFTGKQKFTLTSIFPACTAGSLTGCDSNLGSKTTGEQACCYLNGIEQLFKDDGTVFANAIAAEAGYDNTVKAALVNKMKDRVSSSSPAWVAKAASMAVMLRNMVLQTNVTSNINIYAPTGDTFTGNEDWKTFLLFWKLDCDPVDPEYYACGKFELSMTGIGGISYSPVIAKSNFTGSLGTGNNFSIDTHTIGLNPGRLLVYAVNKVAAVTLTGGYINDSAELITVGAAADLKDAYSRWFDCTSIADTFFGQVSGITDKEGLRTACLAAVDTAMADVNAAQAALVVDSHLSLSGAGAYIETSCNGSANELSAGVYTGNYVRGSEQTAISGTFSGVN